MDRSHPVGQREVRVAATQFACSWDLQKNLEAAERAVRAAAAAGAQIIVLQELFEAPYFCQTIDPTFFSLAKPIDQNPAVALCRKLAAELDVVLPVSTFERDPNQRYFNSVTIVDAGGDVLGTYRKTHIPDGPGYFEKYYFNPGDTGHRVWHTRYATLGVGICWDQWFVEASRAMALQGAEILLFPTAIGSSPIGMPTALDGAFADLQDTALRHSHWRNVQCGHAAANMMPLVASNRIGVEKGGDTRIEFFGHSFIANQRGEVVKEMDDTTEGFVMHTFDLEAVHLQRAAWGLLRDRRPDVYGALTR
ncbi:carbon-nitrogen hydrolase [Burkholderia guangdongensis]|uniref:carbon-nitrogen hydrolase n=1 Tax=Burkholderia guangdongensis TaxID=1792500 RepID=UPI0015C80363|nr:carbon-nitrogen hydrolase [Burkholderia guangdongensis]